MENRKDTKKLKKEFSYLILILIIFIMIFKGIFYEEALSNVIRLVGTYFILIVLPGFILMIPFSKKFSFEERFLLGVGVGATLLALTSYAVGFIYANLYFHVTIYFILVISSFLVIKIKCKIT